MCLTKWETNKTKAAVSRLRAVRAKVKVASKVVDVRAEARVVRKVVDVRVGAPIVRTLASVEVSSNRGSPRNTSCI
jgi:hypothetical protein